MLRNAMLKLLVHLLYRISGSRPRMIIKIKGDRYLLDGTIRKLAPTSTTTTCPTCYDRQYVIAFSEYPGFARGKRPCPRCMLPAATHD